MKKCNFYVGRGLRDWCMLKDDEVSSQTYQNYCRSDEMEKCPIYRYDRKNK